MTTIAASNTAAFQQKAATDTATHPVASLLFLALVAGSVATLAFDIWGSVISPALGFAKLSPVALGTQTVKVLTGIDSPVAGSFMHLFAVGLIGYPLGWLAVFRPLQRRILPNLPLPLSATGYGIGLFVVAIGIIAGPLVAGNPWFLGWAQITWISLIGHVLYAAALVATLGALETRAA